MSYSSVLRDLHVAFAGIRQDSDVPTGVDFVLTGNGMSFLTLTIETLIVPMIGDDHNLVLVTYKIEIDPDTPYGLMISMGGNDRTVVSCVFRKVN